MWKVLQLVVVAWCMGRGSMQLPSKKFIYNDTYLYDVIYHLTVDADVDQILDFQESNDTLVEYPTRVHVLAPPEVAEDHPLFVTATQQRGVSSWKLPLVVRQNYRKPTMYREMARTLCPYGLSRRKEHPQEKYSEGRPRIQLSTWNPQPLATSIKLRRIKDFYLRAGQETSSKAAPGAPVLYYYDFEAPPNATDVWNAEGGSPYSVLLHFESDDELCTIVSVQDVTCPVLDDESEVQYRGLRLTAMRRAAVTVPAWMFPNGFFVVVIVKENDDACRSSPAVASYPTRDGNSLQDRVKHFRLSIKPTLPYRRYVVVALLTFGLLVAFYGAVELVALCRWPRAVREEGTEPLHGESVVDDGAVDDSAADGNRPQGAAGARAAEDATSLSSSVVYPDDVHFQTVSVAALCKTPHAVRARRSRLYVWQALTVAVVYALPVLQLLASYQKAALSAGNLDLCYYNALCAHPFEFLLADFNHVYSNIGYVLLGLLFIVQVRRRAAAVGAEEAGGCGVPQHHGLLYSLGVALITEGVLSAAYHLCPNQMNFQFDSSFMYVTAALCVLTLYHGRQPDAAARAHAAFLALAALFALGVIGTLAPTDAFWAVLTVLHVLTCAALSLHLYYFGGAGAGLVRLVQLVRAEGVRVARPRRAVRLALLFLANGANWTLAIYGWVYYRHELAKHLMLVLVANTAMYTALYVCCKLAQRERVCVRAAIYGLGALLLWAIAFYCFSRSTTKWAHTPAASRELNAECFWMGFYDTHDAWHIASAGAMFLSFNLLLSVDDAQRQQPRHTLPVF